jgi:arginyl-tRNA synthetase
MYELQIKNKLQELTGKKEIKLTVPPPKIEGDLSTNAAMALDIPPEKIAVELEKLDCVEWAKRVGPGFINIKLMDESIIEELKEIVGNPGHYGANQATGDIMFEMVSSNPTGPLHIGHGRGAAIGDSLSKIFEYIGYNVYREYYVNDTGIQMDLLGQSVLNRKEGKDVPENGYKGEYINDVAARMENCNTVKECTDQAGRMILDDHISVLKDFGVEYDNLFFESKLIADGKVEEMIAFLKNKGLTYEKDGALWFKSTTFGDDTDRVLIKNDGDTTYFASDCAYHKNKAERIPNLVDIWGADHHGYVARIKALWEALGYDEDNIAIMLYQLVNLKRHGQKVSMSTRAGEFVTLKEVIDEVGRDAARFNILMRSADAPLDFDMDLAKEESKKNPVYYVQYSHARICSIFRKADVVPATLDPAKIKDLGSEERTVIKKIAHFPHLLNKCAELRTPHLITEYLRDTATTFHKYYDTVRVLGSDNEETRLMLLYAVKEIIKNGLSLVGVSAPDRM